MLIFFIHSWRRYHKLKLYTVTMVAHKFCEQNLLNFYLKPSSAIEQSTKESLFETIREYDLIFLKLVTRQSRFQDALPISYFLCYLSQLIFNCFCFKFF